MTAFIVIIGNTKCNGLKKQKYFKSPNQYIQFEATNYEPFGFANYMNYDLILVKLKDKYSQ